MNKPLRSLLSCLLLACPAQCFAQDAASSAPVQALKIETAVELALQNYPAIRQAQAQVKATEAGIENAGAAYLPRADLLWQENFATRNNVFGLLLPQSTIPGISGPKLDSTSLAGVWGSAGGLLLSWEPFDFGWRKTSVATARAVGNQARAGEAVTRLEVSAAAADAFLNALATEQTVRAAQAGVERAETFLKTVRTLADNQLRPGVDVSRAEADLAAARNQLIQAEQNADLAKVGLAETIGQAGANLMVDPGPLLAMPQVQSSPTLNLSTHPLALAQTAALDVVRARQRELDRAYFPRFNWQTALFGRGSGALLNGQFDRGRGFYPDTMNWATGMTVTFPVFDIFGLRARRRIEAANISVEQARYDQVMQTLKTQDARARTLIEAARRFAANTPVQLRAARETLQRAQVRYEYGLTSVIEVADAQRLVTQAEIEDAVARLAIWRAMLAAAKLQGDLKSFLEQVSGRK
jgi:outer membrane protein TolC